MPKNENRCWPGYEPVKGKEQHEEGSCRPKAKSKLTGGEKQFRSKREKQLAAWKKEHPGSPAKAAQHLHSPEAKPKAATRKSPVKKSTASARKPARKR